MHAPAWRAIRPIFGRVATEPRRWQSRVSRLCTGWSRPRTCVHVACDWADFGPCCKQAMSVAIMPSRSETPPAALWGAGRGLATPRSVDHRALWPSHTASSLLGRRLHSCNYQCVYGYRCYPSWGCRCAGRGRRPRGAELRLQPRQLLLRKGGRWRLVTVRAGRPRRGASLRHGLG